MITLGGTITLDGLDALEAAKLIVVKKLVGAYARRIHDTRGPFTTLAITLAMHDHAHTFRATLTTLTTTVTTTGTASNLFVALDQAFRALFAAGRQ